MFKRALLVLALGLAGCASSENGPLPINKSVVAAENSVGVLGNAAAVLVNVCVLKKDTSAGDIVTKGLTAAGATLDTANADVQAGNVDGIQTLLDIAKAALANAQIAMNQKQPGPDAVVAMHLQMPKAAAAKSIDASGIIALIAQYLPIAISGGAQIADLVKSFIANVHTPDADVTAQAVAEANGSMHLGLNNYLGAACKP